MIDVETVVAEPVAEPEIKPASKPLYTIAETADIFEVSQKTIYQWLKRGWMKAVRAGTYQRITAEEIERFMTKGARIADDTVEVDIPEQDKNGRVSELKSEGEIIDAHIELIKKQTKLKQVLDLLETLESIEQAKARLAAVNKQIELPEKIQDAEARLAELNATLKPKEELQLIQLDQDKREKELQAWEKELKAREKALADAETIPASLKEKEVELNKQLLNKMSEVEHALRYLALWAVEQDIAPEFNVFLNTSPKKQFAILSEAFSNLKKRGEL